MSIKETVYGSNIYAIANGTKMGSFTNLITTSYNWTIDAACLGESTAWDSAIKSENVVKLPPFLSYENISMAEKYFEGYSMQELIYRGSMEWVLNYSTEWEAGAQLQKINTTCRVIIGDEMGNYLMKKNSAGKYQGVEASLQYIKTSLGVAKESATTFKIKLSLLNPSDLNNGSCYIVTPAVKGLNMLGRAHLEINEGAITTTTLQFKATNAANPEEYVTFDAAQKFELTSSTGAALAATVTSQGSGNYTLTFASTPKLGTLRVAKPYLNYWKSNLYTIVSGTSTCVPYEPA